MLTAESLIAKAVVAIVTKSAANLAGLAFDKRKRACRSLTKLYYAVVALDEATDRFLETFSAFRRTSDADALLSALRSQAHLIELASNAFIELSHELEQGLEIIDPALARCCQLLYQGKGDFLSFMSQAVEVRREDETAHLIVYRPNARILSADFEQAYRDSVAAQARGDRYYWPSEALDYFRDFEEVDVSVGDEGLATELVQMIRRQNELLKQARESLRNLIKENFSIEEVLFHSDSKLR
jgi:hypothetical protein